MENYDRDFMSKETNMEFNSFISKALAYGSALDFGMAIFYGFSKKAVLITMGFGEASFMWLIIPIVKMLNFRKADESKLSIIIPFICFGIIGYMWIEAFYWIANFIIDEVI